MKVDKGVGAKRGVNQSKEVAGRTHSVLTRRKETLLISFFGFFLGSRLCYGVQVHPKVLWCGPFQF